MTTDIFSRRPSFDRLRKAATVLVSLLIAGMLIAGSLRISESHLRQASDGLIPTDNPIAMGNFAA